MMQLDLFYRHLNVVRDTHGFTWKQVAKEAGISASTISRMKLGQGPNLNGFAALVRWSKLDANLYCALPGESHSPEELDDIFLEYFKQRCLPVAKRFLTVRETGDNV